MALTRSDWSTPAKKSPGVDMGAFQARVAPKVNVVPDLSLGANNNSLYSPYGRYTPAGSVRVGPYDPKTINEAATRGVLLTPVNPGSTLAGKSGSVPTYNGGTSASTSTLTASAGMTAEQLAAQAKADAITAANTSSRNTATQQKTTLQQQIDANNAQIGTNQTKLDALSDLIANGLVNARDINLANVDNALKTLLDQVRSHYDTQLGDLNTGLRDNEKSESDSSFQNLANRAREKQDLVTQALSQGAGESDVLKSQLQALRNWQGNQSDINRSYFDTLTSTNGSINDLNTGTQTSMTNAELDANAKKSGVWGDFYGGVSDAYTQMDNLATNNYLLHSENAAAQANMGTQDNLLAWLDAGNNAEDWKAPATVQSLAAPAKFQGYAQQAADYAGKAWTDPGVSDATKNWQGQQTQVGNLATSQAWDAQANSSSKGTAAPKRPEGATLRRW